jgi:hypothetical protein
MPLQNRVDPFGAIHADPARGLFTGNRGVIHDPVTKTLLARRWTTRAWIVCTCVVAGRRRDPMGRNAPSGKAGWTELFFLDEVTALAAGHRPCFACRRREAVAFARCFAQGRGRDHLSAPAIDAILHAERFASAPGAPGAPVADPAALPDGTMVAAGADVFAILGGRLLPWRFDGYGAPVLSPPGASLRLVTPRSTVAALAAGYLPAWHPSASPSPPDATSGQPCRRSP